MVGLLKNSHSSDEKTKAPVFEGTYPWPHRSSEGGQGRKLGVLIPSFLHTTYEDSFISLHTQWVCIMGTGCGGTSVEFGAKAPD